MATRAKDKIVKFLQSAIADGSISLSDIPALIGKVIKDEAWQRRYDSRTKKTVIFSSFCAFVEAPLPLGLGTSLPVLQKFCAGEPAILDLIDRTYQSQSRGGDRRSVHFKRDNVTFEIPTRGNSALYGLRRLRKMSPTLHQKVLDGELTTNKAMVEAGLRQQNIYLSRDVHKAGRTIIKHFSPDEIKRLIEFLAIKQRSD